MSSQERFIHSKELEKKSFSERVSMLRASAQKRLRDEPTLYSFVEELNKKYGRELPSEGACDKIAENEGRKLIDEGPMVIALLKAYRGIN